MKFSAGDAVDYDYCIVLTHEFLRCEDAFIEFSTYANQMVIHGQTKKISFKAYNAYTRFLHHLYEFMIGCHTREAGNTNIKYKSIEERIAAIESYITNHAQRIMRQYVEAIDRGSAPYANSREYYDVTIPTDFAKDFREYRNKAIGHVAYERASKLNLTEFYEKYHKFIYALYQDSIYWWGTQGREFPDLNEITAFSVLVVKENS